MLQEWLLRYGAQSAQPIPHQPDGAGAGAQGRTADPGFAQLLHDQTIRQLPVLHQWHFVRAIFHEDLSMRCDWVWNTTRSRRKS